MNFAVDNLEAKNAQNQKKAIPGYSFEFTNKEEIITFNKPNDKTFESKCEERDDDLDFEDGSSSNQAKKYEDFAERAVEEDELVYLKDKRKLEVFID